MIDKLSIVLIAKKMITGMVKLALAIFLLCFTIWLPIWYMARPVNNFCTNLTMLSSYQKLISKAQHLKYRISDNVDAKNGMVFVTPKDTPFFSMVCVVTIKNNIIVKKEVHASD